MVPNAFNNILQWLIKTLTESAVIVEPEEEKESGDSVSSIVDATLMIQNRLISERATGQDEVKAIIDSMIPQVSGNIETATMKKITAAIIPHFQRVNEILKKHSAQIAKLEDSNDLDRLKARVVQLEKELALQASSGFLSKEESKSKDNTSTSPHPCFSFLKNIDNIKPSDIQAKTDFKYRMQHPYKHVPIEILATLELCTVHKGTPYGPALITYEHDDDKLLSFKGVGIFNEG